MQKKILKKNECSEADSNSQPLQNEWKYSDIYYCSSRTATERAIAY